MSAILPWRQTLWCPVARLLQSHHREAYPIQVNLLCPPAPAGGVPADQPAPVAPPMAGMPEMTCNGQRDGTLLAVGPFGDCTYDDDCAQTGTRTRVNQVCTNGVAIETVDTQVLSECERATDGVVVQNGLDGPCEYADQCDEQGTKTRTNRVCDNGLVIDAVDRRDFPTCVRDTDGSVLVEGVFGACTYADACVETGTQSRTNTVCANGRITEVDETIETPMCVRDTDGEVITFGMFSACEYASDCSKIGLQTRTNTVCTDGRAVPQVEEQNANCMRETDNIILVPGVFESCTDFDTVCDLTGSRSKSEQVCIDGLTQEQTITQACERVEFGLTQTEESTTGCINARGGQLSLGGAQIAVPEDAVEQPTVITFTTSGRDEHTGFDVYSETYTVAIGNADLDADITVVMPFIGDAKNAVLFWKSENNTTYTRIPGSIDGNRLTAQVPGSGSGFVANGIDFSPPPDRSCLNLESHDGRVLSPGNCWFLCSRRRLRWLPLPRAEKNRFLTC